MTVIARILDFGMDVHQALPRRGRAASIVGVAIVAVFILWPETWVHVIHLRMERIWDPLMKSVEDIAARRLGQ